VQRIGYAFKVRRQREYSNKYETSSNIRFYSEEIRKLGNYLNSKGEKFWLGHPGTNAYDEPLYWQILFAGQKNVFFNRLKQIVESGLYSFWKSLSMSIIAAGKSKIFKKSGVFYPIRVLLM